jgi:hypothetical protein
MVLEACQELGEEVVDRDNRLIRQIGEVERIERLAHGVASGSVSSCATAARGRFRPGKDLQVELFIERRNLALGGAHEQLSGHGDEDAVVAGGVIDEGVAQLLGHQGGVAGTLEQMIQARQQLIAGGELGRQSKQALDKSRSSFKISGIISCASSAKMTQRREQEPR